MRTLLIPFALITLSITSYAMDSHPPAMTAEQLPEPPSQQEREDRLGKAPIADKSCIEIDKLLFDQTYNEGLLPEDQFFLSWQKDLNADGVCEGLVSSQGAHKTGHRVITSHEKIPQADTRAMLPEEPELAWYLETIGDINAISIVNIYPSENAYADIEARYYDEPTKTLQYRLYHFVDKLYRLKLLDRYELSEDCNCYTFVERIIVD